MDREEKEAEMEDWRGKMNVRQTYLYGKIEKTEIKQ